MRWRYNRTHRSRKKKHQQRMSLQSLPLQKRTLKKSSITSPKFSPVSATTTAMGTLGVMHLGMARVVSFSADRPQYPPPMLLTAFPRRCLCSREVRPTPQRAHSSARGEYCQAADEY